MNNPRAETVRRDLDALFHLGVVGGMSDGQLLERFMSRGQDGGCDPAQRPVVLR